MASFYRVGAHEALLPILWEQGERVAWAGGVASLPSR